MAGARGENEVWGVRGRYTCNTTSIDTLYSSTVVEVARIEGSPGVYNITGMKGPLATSFSYQRVLAFVYHYTHLPSAVW